MASASLHPESPPPRPNLDWELRCVLSRYLSTVTTEAVLKRMYQDASLEPEQLTLAELERLYQSSLFSSLRMFCRPERLTSAMMDLAELLESLSEQS